MKLKDIIGMAAYQVNKLKGSTLSTAYTTLRGVYQKRAAVFKKHGAETALPAGFRSGMRSASDLTDAEKLQDIKAISAWMRGSRSTYTGWKRSEIDQMEKLNDLLDGDFEFKSLDDFRKYGEFMGEMQARYGDMWKYASSQVRELYFQAERLGVKPEMFQKNYEYWMEHLEELQRAKPIQWKPGARELKPSDYARQLKLPKIKSYYENQSGIYSHRARKKK